jgi:hypothetical protein
MQLIEELRKPYNLLSTAIGVLGIIIGLWLFFLGQEKREPYYLAGKTTQVFDSAASFPTIKLTDKAGTQVNENVYLTEIAIWNGGGKPIEPSDVRIPLAVQLTGANRILDFSVIKQNQPLISEFAIAADPQVPNRLSISFKHLDPGIGARIKVLYAGKEAPEVSLQGAIVGARFINGNSLIDEYLPSYVTIFLAALVGALVSRAGQFVYKKIPNEWPAFRRRFIKFSVFILSVAILLFALKIFFGFTVPPI